MADTDLKAYSTANKAGVTVKVTSQQHLQRRPWWKFGGKDYSHVSVDASYDIRSETSSLSENTLVVNENNVYADSDAASLYKPIEGYEGAHRFEPDATWSKNEEEALVRKLDWRIALPACIMFFALQLDRGNIVQAISDTMLSDLKLTTNDYNNGMTIFYCSFLFAELPSQLVSKKLGPDVWIPIQMVAWSIVAAAQSQLTGHVILYLSYFYKNAELPKRLSWFWTSYQSTSIIDAFLAYGILHLRGHTGLKQGWRYIFCIEGSLTAFIGIITWFYLPASPTQTARGRKGLLRPKNGWFSEREEVIMVTRILRDDPGKATMHNRQALSLRYLWQALTDFDLWPIYLIGLTWQVPFSPPTAYITLTCKALGFDTFHTNLLTIPAYTLFILQLLFWTWVSEKINQRMLIGLISQLWALPLLLALEVLPKHFPHSNWAKWAISTLVVGYPYPHAVLVAATSRNSGSVRTRTVGSSLYNMAVQTASIIGSQIYRAHDKPYYYKGNKVLLGIGGWNIVLFIAAKVYYTVKNNNRDKIWNSWTREERLNYLATTKDEGNKRLDFRLAS